MANPESPAETTLRFINSWSTKVSPRLESELLSLSNETNRKPDLYSFEISQEGLIDPKTKRLVKEFILKNSPIQKAEHEVFENLEKFAIQQDEGLTLWLSPPSTEYPCAKAIFSRIVYDLKGNKHLANSAILFGNQDTDCSGIIPSLEPDIDIRKSLFVLDENDDATFAQIIKNIENYTKINSDNINQNNLFQAKLFAGMIEKGMAPDLIVEKMIKTNFLGQFPISCPNVNLASNVLLLNSRVFNLVNSEFKPGVCRVCHQHTHVGPCSICNECEQKFA